MTQNIEKLSRRILGSYEFIDSDGHRKKFYEGGFSEMFATVLISGAGVFEIDHEARTIRDCTTEARLKVTQKKDEKE